MGEKGLKKEGKSKFAKEENEGIEQEKEEQRKTKGVGGV